MVPTIEWMQQKFALYNKKYFNGQIAMPKFSTNCPHGMWGYFKLDAICNPITRKITQFYDYGTLFLTDKYERNAKDVVNTLLHEMIHAYIYTVLKKYPFNQHGRDFKEIANKLNSVGWNISEANEMKTTDKLRAANPNKQKRQTTGQNGSNGQTAPQSSNGNGINDLMTILNNVSTNGSIQDPTILAIINQLKQALNNQQNTINEHKYNFTERDVKYMINECLKKIKKA